MIPSLNRLPGKFNYLRSKERRTRVWPMNGQTARCQAVREIVSHCRIEQIVETGTNLGDSADWFAQMGLPFFTSEIKPHWSEFSRLRLQKYKNANVVEGRSTDLIKRLAADHSRCSLRTFFYLDAHWQKYLPLRNEVELIADRFPKSVTMIDDFQVPDDPGYRFDDYGPDQRISLEYLRPLNKEFSIFFPSTASHEETGRRRGSAVLAMDEEISLILERLPELRRWVG